MVLNVCECNKDNYFNLVTIFSSAASFQVSASDRNSHIEHCVEKKILEIGTGHMCISNTLKGCLTSYIDTML